MSRHVGGICRGELKGQKELGWWFGSVLSSFLWRAIGKPSQSFQTTNPNQRDASVLTCSALFPADSGLF